MLQEPNYIEIIADKFGSSPNQIEVVLNLIQQGATVPFIARYRKEKTGNLDENQIRQILEIKKQEENLFKAKQTAINGIAEKGKLTKELEKNIIQAQTLKEVEEIYKPYKSKKKTKAMIAEEKGLLPVARLLKNIGEGEKISENNFKDGLKNNLKQEKFEKIKDLDEKEIILGALEILSAEIVQNTKLRDFLRNELLNNSLVISKIKGEKVLEKLPEASKNQIHKFEIYKDFSVPVKKIKSYQILAINRGENLGILSKKIELDDFEEKFYEQQEKIFGYHYLDLVKNLGKILELKTSEIPSSYKKLFESVQNEIFGILKGKAEDDGIQVFQSNLFELLMTRPVYGKKILAIDPGYRTGSKLVVLDEFGNPLEFDKIYLHKEAEAKEILGKYLPKVDIVVIGNGTGSGETAELVLNLTAKDVYIVNESGASVYSASKLAQEEFPNLDLTDRGTVSIGRRFLDPLSELEKFL